MGQDLYYRVPAEQREQSMEEVRRTRTFRYFIEERPYEDQQCLFREIDNILENGIPFEEYILTGMKYSNMIGETDYRKVAVFCFAETMNEVISRNRERTKSLQQSPHFTETYNDVFSQIADYLENRRTDFPKEALRCLFLLTDEDSDPHRQGLTVTRLIIESYVFCSSGEQREEIERLVKECMIIN